MRSFLLKSLLFFAVFFVLDKALVIVRNTAPERELDKRLEMILKGEINADVIVLGSSRGARDIIASEIADSLHVSAYNLSYPGSNIEFHEYLLSKLFQFKNKVPKLIILAVDDATEFKIDPTINFRYERLYPLIKYTDVRNTLIGKGEKDKILSSLFIVHQLSISNFDFRKKHFDNLDTLYKDGSMPISSQSEKFKNVQFTNHYNYYKAANENPKRIQSFLDFIALCKSHNTTLLFALAPNFGNPTIGFKERITQYVQNDNPGIMMYDTSNNIYKNSSFYFDPGHLNRRGASVFTGELIDYIRQKKLLKQ